MGDTESAGGSGIHIPQPPPTNTNNAEQLQAALVAAQQQAAATLAQLQAVLAAATPQVNPAAVEAEAAQATAQALNQQVGLLQLEQLRKLTPNPAQYSGKKGENNHIWLSKLKLWFSIVGVEADVDKLRIATAYLTEDASFWLMNNITTIHTFSELEARLLMQYRDVAAIMKARDEMVNARQITDVAAYNAYYNRILVQLGNEVDVGTQIYHYKRGLKADIGKLVQLNNPQTLQECMQLAGTIDSIGRATSMQHNGFVQKLNSIEGDVGTTLPTATAAESVGGHSLNAIQGKSLTDQGLTSAQVRDRRKAGACYKCGRMGHAIRDCKQQNFQ